ncbi:MAG: ornithine cyclodeaminase family protein [SAR202 cluster bacterium]|nr:ornithine cyclodeaminase family protein [SAR202 cluster bacterium]
MALLLGDKEVTQVMSMKDCVGVMDDAFKQAGNGQTWNRPRSRIRMPRGFHHLMAAAVLGSKVFGLKTYTSFRAGVRFMIVLYDSETGDLLALVQGSQCSLMRTGAVTGVATKYMARQNASTVGIIGTGFQGRGQLEGVCAVRNVKSVKAFDAVPESLNKFCGDMSKKLGIEVKPAASAQDCVKGVDMVITMTTSREPVLLGDWLEAGQHVNAAGSNHWIRREVDDNVIKRSNIVVVDSLEDAKVEAGDLLYPIERGVIRWDQIHELASVAVGRVHGRDNDQQITLFESQGVAISDVAAAAYVYKKAKEQGLGTEIKLEL